MTRLANVPPTHNVEELYLHSSSHQRQHVVSTNTHFLPETHHPSPATCLSACRQRPRANRCSSLLPNLFTVSITVTAPLLNTTAGTHVRLPDIDVWPIYAAVLLAVLRPPLSLRLKSCREYIPSSSLPIPCLRICHLHYVGRLLFTAHWHLWH
eukprot:GGOE01048846.1.p2 GENE.GGOE01048846.1~~GGOE01048846.1.p2  ORF type:complete len:153 (+),score=9.65 GGOE01048846.1:128-586(+)